NIRATAIINADNQSIIVPNREFITANLVNWTHKDRVIRVSIPLRVAPGTDLDRVSDLLLTIAREDADVLRNPVPSAAFEKFSQPGPKFSLNVPVPDPSVPGRLRHNLGARIQERFREAGITMPVPARDLHLRSAPPEWSPRRASTEAPRTDPKSPTPP